MPDPEYQPLAQVEVDQVSPERDGFTLSGVGADRAQYQLALRFDMPLDPRTRAVLGELLSQSEFTVSRRAPTRRGAASRLKDAPASARNS